MATTMLIEMAMIAQSRKDRLRLKLLIRDDAPDRRQHRQAVGGCCAQGMRARVQLRKILHLLLPRAGPGASHAHAHPNRLPKLRPHRRHVSDLPRILVCSQCGHGAFIKQGSRARSPTVTREERAAEQAAWDRYEATGAQTKAEA
jgi:hypothetical protein